VRSFEEAATALFGLTPISLDRQKTLPQTNSTVHPAYRPWWLYEAFQILNQYSTIPGF